MLFLKQLIKSKVGIIFYHNRKFSLKNQTVCNMINININIYHRYSLSKTWKKLTQQVLEYKRSKFKINLNHQENSLIFSGILNLEYHNLIIIVYYPDLFNTIKYNINLLKTITRNYLLYFETRSSEKFNLFFHQY